MSARTSEKSILKHSWLKGMVTPDYGGRGIADVIPTIFKGFGLKSGSGIEGFDTSLFKGIKNIALLTIDGLGYDMLAKGKLLKKMDCMPLTSVAPSTTPVALSTLATGLTPQEHGIVGFWVYFQELGDVVSLLRFGPASGIGSYEDVGILPEIFFPVPTAFEQLQAKGIHSFVMNRNEYAQGPLSQMIYRDAHTIPYRSRTELFSHAATVLTKPGRKFVYLYWDTIDVTCHHTGKYSKQTIKELVSLEGKLEGFLDKMKRETLFLLTADHGQIDIPLRRTHSFLDHPELLSMLTSPPSGEARMCYLFAKKGKERKVKEYLMQHFSQKAVVIESEKLLKRGLFGRGVPLKETRERLGTFTLIAKHNHLFSYPYIEGRGLVGFHGGLSKEEMLVPFVWKRVDCF